MITRSGPSASNWAFAREGLVRVEEGGVVVPARQARERARSVDMRRSIRHDEVERSGDLGYMLSTVRLAIDLSNRREPAKPGQFAYGVKLGDRGSGSRWPSA
jgi:hypothetical protein